MMRLEYLNALYQDWLKVKSDQELLDVIDYIIKILERRKTIVFAKLIVKEEKYDGR